MFQFKKLVVEVSSSVWSLPVQKTAFYFLDLLVRNNGDFRDESVLHAVPFEKIDVSVKKVCWLLSSKQKASIQEIILLMNWEERKDRSGMSIEDVIILQTLIHSKTFRFMDIDAAVRQPLWASSSDTIVKHFVSQERSVTRVGNVAQC